MQKVYRRGIQGQFRTNKDAAMLHLKDINQRHEPTATPDKDSSRAYIEDYNPTKASLETTTLYRRFAISTLGYMGLVPREARAGDLICIIFGATTPNILRPLESGGNMRYELVGHCYMHGLMDGEGMAMLAEGKAKVTDFVLV